VKRVIKFLGNFYAWTLDKPYRTSYFVKHLSGFNRFGNYPGGRSGFERVGRHIEFDDSHRNRCRNDDLLPHQPTPNGHRETHKMKTHIIAVLSLVAIFLTALSNNSFAQSSIPAATSGSGTASDPFIVSGTNITLSTYSGVGYGWSFNGVAIVTYVGNEPYPIDSQTYNPTASGLYNGAAYQDGGGTLSAYWRVTIGSGVPAAPTWSLITTLFGLGIALIVGGAISRRSKVHSLNESA
jgi:hypothetical protein